MAPSQASSHEPLLVVILGPTASGKSSLALALAQSFAGEIVSCDSVAVYRGFEIGTAKPSQAERQLVPHHLIDVTDPKQAFTAGEYARRARVALAEIASRKHLPIVVGGTGLYLRALLEGLFHGPPRSEDVRERLRETSNHRGPTYLHRLLSRLDAKSASLIHPNDLPKVIRAIEVCMAARAPMSELWRQHGRDRLEGFRVLRIGLNPEREALYQRINQRAGAMFENGLIEETRGLLAHYGDASRVTPLTSLGYSQAVQYLRGELTREQAIGAAQQGHRNYAKRQMSWFRREPHVHWLAGFGDDQEIARLAAGLIQPLLGPERLTGPTRV